MLTILYVIGAILTFMFVVGYISYDDYGTFDDKSSASVMMSILFGFLLATIWPLTVVVWGPRALGRWLASP